MPTPLNPLTGKAEPNGTSIVDVTDPANPKYLRHIPGAAGQVRGGRRADGARLRRQRPAQGPTRAAVYMLRTFGGEAHEIWDVTDPANPALLTRLDGLKDTHKNWWECDTGIAYLVSGAPDWRTKRMTQIYDLSDPAKPVNIRDFGLPGQEPGATGAVPTELHGPISTGPQGNRVYFGYGTNKGGVAADRRPREAAEGAEGADAGQSARARDRRGSIMSPWNGAHTTFPMLQMPIAEFASDKDGGTRDIVMIVDESILNECQRGAADGVVRRRLDREPADGGVELDRARGERQFLPARRTLRRAFLQREHGRRSTTRRWPSSPSSMPACARSTSAIPINPKEVGYFIPAITDKTDKRCVKVDGKDRCKTAIQTNNVETDDRGYIYIVDRANTGMHILELTGGARTVAGLK